MPFASCLKSVPELYPNPPPSKDVFPPRLQSQTLFLLILWPKTACIHFCTEVHLQQAAHSCPAYSLIFKILP